MPTLHQLPWDEFEELIKQLLVKMGFEKVERVGGPHDYGADVIAIKRDEFGTPVKYVVQCKRYSPDRSVGVADVQRLAGTLKTYGADRAVLITTSKFTRSAIRAASEMGIKLIDGQELESLITRHGLARKVSRRRARRKTLESLILNLPRTNPPKWSVHARDVSEIVRIMLSELEKIGVRAEDLSLLRITLEAEPIYVVKWMCKARRRDGSIIDERGETFVGPEGEVRSHSDRLGLRAPKGKTERIDMLLKLVRKRSKIASREFSTKLRGVRVREVNRLQGDRQKAGSLVRKVVAHQLEVGEKKVVSLSVDKFLVGIKWTIELNVEAGNGIFEYDEIDQKISMDLPNLGSEEIGERASAWFNAVYGEVPKIINILSDDYWAKLKIESKERVGEIKVHRVTGRVEPVQIFLRSDRVIELLEERHGMKVAAIELRDSTYYAILEGVESYAAVEVEAESGDEMRFSERLIDDIRRVSLDILRQRVPLEDWDIESMVSRLPSSLVIAAKARGGSSLVQYDIFAGEGRVIKINISREGAMRLAKAEFPGFELKEIRKQGSAYFINLQNEEMEVDIRVLKAGELNVIDKRWRKKIAEAMAIRAWREKYGISPGAVVSRLDDNWLVEGVCDGWRYEAVISRAEKRISVRRMITREKAREIAINWVGSMPSEIKIWLSKDEKSWIVRMVTEEIIYYIRIDGESGQVLESEKLKGFSGKLKEVIVKRRFS